MTATATHPALRHPYPALDDRDAAILAERQTALDAITGPRVGDFVRFADGITRRISYEWSDGKGWHGGFQTSDGGSFYLGKGYVSMSGSLYSTVPAESLTDTGETMTGRVWFFHHDWAGADRGVDALATFRVYDCNLPAPR